MASSPSSVGDEHKGTRKRIRELETKLDVVRGPVELARMQELLTSGVKLLCIVITREHSALGQEIQRVAASLSGLVIRRDGFQYLTRVCRTNRDGLDSPSCQWHDCDFVYDRECPCSAHPCISGWSYKKFDLNESKKSPVDLVAYDADLESTGDLEREVEHGSEYHIGHYIEVDCWIAVGSPLAFEKLDEAVSSQSSHSDDDEQEEGDEI